MSCGCDTVGFDGAAAAWVLAEFGYRYGVRRSHQRLLYLEALGTVAREAGAGAMGGGERHMHIYSPSAWIHLCPALPLQMTLAASLALACDFLTASLRRR